MKLMGNIKSVLKYIYMFLLCLCFASCDDDDITTTKIYVEVDAVAGDYYPIMLTGSTPPSQPGMYVRFEGENKWRVWSQHEISGFTYQEGFYYKLLVKKTVDNKRKEELGVHHDVTHTLIRIIEETPSESVRKD